MQAYGPSFARVYNRHWCGFANRVAPLIHDFHAAAGGDPPDRSLLDLCCGTGHLSLYFLERGYRVVGLDLSEPMLAFARDAARAYLDAGRARFILADAARFHTEDRFDVVVATYDALNHLPDEAALAACFQCAGAVCDGFFLFDLNTRAGLRRWTRISVDENDDDIVIINRGLCDEPGGRAWTRISGFARTESGLYERFEETVFNTMFDLKAVEGRLREAGWPIVYFARIGDLMTPIDEPEKEGRVWVVAGKRPVPAFSSRP